MKQTKARSISSNFFYSIGQTILAAIITIFINAFIARRLGPHEFGIFSLGVSIIASYYFLTAFGLRTVLVRKISKLSQQPAEYSDLISRFISIRFLLSLFTVLIICIFIQLMGYSYTTKLSIVILSVGLLFDGISTTFRDLFQGLERMDLVAVTDLIVRASSAILAAIFLLCGMHVYAVMFAYSAASFNALVYTFLLSRKMGVKVNFFRVEQPYKLLKKGAPFVLTGFVSVLYLRMDSIIISKILSEEAVGYYNASANLIARVNVIPDAIVSAIFPVFVRRISDSNYIAKLFQQQFRYIALAGLVLWIVLYSLAKVIVLGIYGELFGPSVEVMEVLSFALPFVFLVRLQSAVMQALNEELAVMKVAWISLFLNLTLDIFLIPIYGIIGGAYATLISQVFFSLMIFRLLKKQNFLSIPIDVIGKLAGVFLLCIIGKYFFDLLAQNTFFCLALTFLLFLLGVYFSKLITYEEMRTFSR